MSGRCFLRMQAWLLYATGAGMLLLQSYWGVPLNAMDLIFIPQAAIGFTLLWRTSKPRSGY